jgi:hypothetical protein
VRACWDIIVIFRYLLLDTDGIRSAKMLEENICWRCVGQQAAFSLDLQLENLTFSKTDSTLNFLWVWVNLRCCKNLANSLRQNPYLSKQGVGPQDSVLDNLTPSTINLTSSCDDTNSRLAALEVAQSTEEMTEILCATLSIFKAFLPVSACITSPIFPWQNLRRLSVQEPLDVGQATPRLFPGPLADRLLPGGGGTAASVYI